jgi:hypothetical protein
VTLDPNGFFPHFRLGELYLRIGVNTRAREELSRAMDLSTSVEQSEMVVRLLQIETQRSHRRSRP